MRRDAAFGMIPVLSLPPGLEAPWRYLLILHNKGHWGFPKGHQDPGEGDLETAQRELQEETGITQYNVMESARFTEHYQFVNPSGVKIHKTVLYYLAWIDAALGHPEPTVTIQAAELSDYRWCTYEEGLELITFEAGRGVLRDCEIYLQQWSSQH